MNKTPKPQTNEKIPVLAFRRKEAAQLLNISVESLDHLRGRGLIKASVGLSCPLFSVKELQRFLDDTTNQ
jgi:hypothetical protein